MGDERCDICCRPRSAHKGRDLQCDETTYFRPMPEAADEIAVLRERVGELDQYAREISKAITGLTVGAGSEWFKPVGDEFYVDPAFASARLSEMLNKGREARKLLARAILAQQGGEA